MAYVGSCSEPLFLHDNGTIRCFGQFTQFDTSTVLTVFDLSQLDPAILASAFGAGVIIVATAEATGIAVATLINFIKR